MTAAELNKTYGRRWKIRDGIGGGWYAIRVGDLSQALRDRGLSLVVCSATLEGLARGLEDQTRLEARLCMPWHEPPP